MATRRIPATQEKTSIGQPSSSLSTAPADIKSDVRPAVPSSVIAKLLGFTFAMITFPLGSYFLSVNTIFKGNSTYAGALAAGIANVVLIGYVVVAFWDDQSEREEAERKKAR